MGVDCFMAARQIVVFKLQGQEFGIDIMKVLEILNYCTIRNVPEVPNYIEGIINVRGTVYPIINLRTRLQIAPCEDEGEGQCKIILLNLEETRVGFMVDSVSEILTVEESDIEQSPYVNQAGKISFLEGIVKKEDKMILVLDVNVLISDEENIMLEEIKL